MSVRNYHVKTTKLATFPALSFHKRESYRPRLCSIDMWSLGSHFLIFLSEVQYQSPSILPRGERRAIDRFPAPHIRGCALRLSNGAYKNPLVPSPPAPISDINGAAPHALMRMGHSDSTLDSPSFHFPPLCVRSPRGR